MRGDNPFRPGSGLEPPYFAGRGAETGEFARLLRRLKAGKAENAVVCGLRGVGKTVLLRRFSRMCGSEGFLPVTGMNYDASRCDPTLFIKSFRHDVESAIATIKMEGVGGKIRSAGEYLKPKSIGVPGVISYEPSYDQVSSAPLDAEIKLCVTQGLEKVQKSGIGGLVAMMDEFHTVTDAEASGWNVLGSLIAAFNELQQEGLPVSLVLCGLPPMVANVKNARSYSERMFGSMEVSNLNADAAKNAILKPLSHINKSFSDETISAIIYDTEGYPYFIQFFSSEIIERIDARHVELGDYDKVRQSIIEKLGNSFFAQRIASLSDTQKRVLFEIASSKNDACFSTICKKMNMSKGAISGHLRRLDQKGIIYKQQRGLYRFAMPMFKKYILSSANR